MTACVLPSMGRVTNPKAAEHLTFEEASALWGYDPDTGLITWKVARGTRTKVGDIAGCVNKAHGYCCIVHLRRGYKAHRLAWLLFHGAWPQGVIDHINGDKTDNRIANLRDVDVRTNCENLRDPLKRAGRSSRYLGVTWNIGVLKWIAAIRVNRRLKHLGCFEVEEEAASAYIEAKRRLHAGCTI